MSGGDNIRSSDSDPPPFKAARLDLQVQQPISPNSSEVEYRKIEPVKIDWQFGKALPECLGTILSKKHLCDVSFKFPDETITLEAHKLILAARSPVFEAMLFGPAGEKDDHPVIPIIDDCSSDFASMLEFMYTDNLDMNNANALGVLRLSHRYRLQYLTQVCCDYLAKTLHPANVIMRLLTAIQLDLPLLQERCLIHVDRYAVDVFSDDDFCELSEDALVLILQRDSLNISEIEVYRGTMSWARARCRDQNLEDIGENVKRILGSTIDLIRFPCMQAAEISLEVTSDDVLNNEELLQALLNIATPSKHPTKFNTMRRQSTFKHWPFSIYQRRPTRKLPVLVRQTVKIDTEKRVFLLGFGLLCQLNTSESVTVQGKIVLTVQGDEHMAPSIVQECTDFEVKVEQVNHMYVYFLQALLLLPAKDYILDMDLQILKEGAKNPENVTVGLDGISCPSYTLQDNGFDSLCLHSSVGLSQNGASKAT